MNLIHSHFQWVKNVPDFTIASLTTACPNYGGPQVQTCSERQDDLPTHVKNKRQMHRRSNANKNNAAISENGSKNLQSTKLMQTKKGINVK